MGQVTIELEGNPVMIAEAVDTSAPADVSFVHPDLAHLDIRSGLSLRRIEARLFAHAHRVKQQMTRKTEGIIGPVYA
jgi:hypothetical protein